MGMNNLQVTRYPNGVVNQAENTIFGGQLPFPINLEQRVFDDDFYTYTAAQWTVTETQAGATQALLNPGDGGLLALVNSAADNDLNAIQRVAAGISGESWGPLLPGKRLWARFRIGVSDATDSDWVAGLQITDVTPLAVSDGIFFRKADDGTSIVLVCVKDAAETTLAVGTCLAATVSAAGVQANFMNLDFFWDGQGATAGRLYAALNGVVAGYIEPGAASFPDDEALTLSFAIQNGAAAAKTMWLDRALVIQDM